jgi:transcriptional regulator with GAF, ATPase, and Fis domain
VKINCAALNLSLIESELFGHEKGAFTGAIDRKIGKFERASGGTVFLDEIGELPLEQQVKLLRVLQEREVERLGGSHPIKIDVRVIAATNRNLEKEVAEGRFRLDLYYRLNVFPILLPALRERKDDIRLLATHFATRFAHKMNKAFHGLSLQMQADLDAYHWPGNIRELENIIEQAIILNDGTTVVNLKTPLLRMPSPSDHLAGLPVAIPSGNSLQAIKSQQRESEKEYILGILRQTKGRIRGAGGAAELLSQKPTTLESRIVKLGIRKDEYSA